MGNEQGSVVILWSMIVMIAMVSLGLIILTSCTVSMTNIDTHGSSSDLVDEEQDATANPNLTIPMSSL